MPLEQNLETSKLLERGAPTNAPSPDYMWIVLFLNGVHWFTYYGISQGFKNFMEDRLKYSKVTATAIRSTWASFCEIVPLFGAYVGDEVWGRYTTLSVFSFWFVGAAVLLAIAALPSVLVEHPAIANALFLIALFGGIAIAIGCFHPNIVTFGADQFHADNQGSKEMFFSHYYLTANFGSSVAYAYLTYLSINGLGTLVPVEYGYVASFALSGAGLVAAAILFAANSHRFVKLEPHAGAFTDLFATLWASCASCPRLNLVVGGGVAFVLSFLLNSIAAFLPSTSSWVMWLTWLAGGFVLFGIVLWIPLTIDVAYVDEALELPSSVRYNIKQVLHMLLLACFHVMWQCILDQQDANFQSIAQQSDLRLGSGRYALQVPGAMLGIFDTLGVLLVAPILDYLVYPRIEAWSNRKLSAIDKMSAGFALAALTMAYTGLVETWRRQSGVILLDDGLGPIVDLGTHKPMNNLSWGYIAVSYLLESCCECLINIPSYEVFYTHVPLHWKSTSQAIRSFMLGMGGNVASIFTLCFASYIPDDLNDGHLEYVFYAMAAVAAVNALGFVYAMKASGISAHSVKL